MGSKAPAYLFYPKDYESDEAVKLMTYEQEGVYRKLLDHQALHGGLPEDVDAVARLAPKVSLRRFKALWPAMADKFPIVDGRRVNAKMKRVLEQTDTYRAKKAAAGKQGADGRWQS